MSLPSVQPELLGQICQTLQGIVRLFLQLLLERYKVLKFDTAMPAYLTVLQCALLYQLHHVRPGNIQEVGGFLRGQLMLLRHEHDRLLLAHQS
jgi:hypothetical protein